MTLKGGPLPALENLLATEFLGFAEAVVGFVPVAEGRLAVQVICRVGNAAVRRFARLEALDLEEEGKLDLHLACAAGDLDAVWTIAANDRLGGDASVRRLLTPDKHGCLPVLYAQAGKRKQVVALLASKTGLAYPEDWKLSNRDGFDAATQGDLRTVLTLLAQGFDVNRGCPNQKVCHYGWTLLMSAARGGQLQVVEVLIAAGAATNVVNNLGQKAVDLAAIHGHFRVVDFLMALKMYERRDLARCREQQYLRLNLKLR